MNGAPRFASTVTLYRPAAAGTRDWWVVDLAPIFRDPLLTEMLSNYGVFEVPETMPVPMISAPDDVQPGQLRPLSRWGPWVSIGASVLTGLFALLTLVAARARGKPDNEHECDGGHPKLSMRTQ